MLRHRPGLFIEQRQQAGQSVQHKSGQQKDSYADKALYAAVLQIGGRQGDGQIRHGDGREKVHQENQNPGKSPQQGLARVDIHIFQKKIEQSDKIPHFRKTDVEQFYVQDGQRPEDKGNGGSHQQDSQHFWKNKESLCWAINKNQVACFWSSAPGNNW